MNTFSNTKIGLSVFEAGWLLQKTEAQVRGMLRRGELSYAVAGRKIEPASVRMLLHCEYAELMQDVVLAGGIEAPRPERRHGGRAPLLPGVIQLALETGFVVHPDEIEWVMNEIARVVTERSARS
jgi:hypothetical protein